MLGWVEVEEGMGVNGDGKIKKQLKKINNQCQKAQEAEGPQACFSETAHGLFHCVKSTAHDKRIKQLARCTTSCSRISWPGILGTQQINV